MFPIILNVFCTNRERGIFTTIDLNINHVLNWFKENKIITYNIFQKYWQSLCRIWHTIFEYIFGILFFFQVFSSMSSICILHIIKPSGRVMTVIRFKNLPNRENEFSTSCTSYTYETDPGFLFIIHTPYETNRLM